MAMLIDPNNKRSVLGLLLAADAGSWGRVVDQRSGAIGHAIPSQRYVGVYHLSTSETCTCTDFRRHGPEQPCKHVIAVRIADILTGSLGLVSRRRRQLHVLPSVEVFRP
jgi:hypothetical protein